VRRSVWVGMLAVLVVAAMGVRAAGAQAEPAFEADSYPATLTGVPTTATVFGFHPGGGATNSWSCAKPAAAGELSVLSSSVLLPHTYSECTWVVPPMPGTLPSVVTIFVNSCKWNVHGLSKVATGSYKALVNLECPSGQEMLIELRQGTFVICKMHVPSQGNKSQVTLLDKANKEEKADDSVELSFAVEKLLYHLESLSALCPATSGTYEDLSIKGSESFTAKTKAGGVQTGLRVSG
jgi:hypothetical protein